jgi:hypothetical protein
MLACKTPSSLEKGSILFSFEGVSYDDNTSSVEAHEWHVRSIQLKPTRKATFINLVSKKKGTTWIKGDWAKYIAKDYQIKFELNDRLPDGIYTTQLQAVKYAYKKQYEYIAFAKSKLAEAKSKKDKDLWSVNVADYERELVRLKSRLTKITNQNKKAYFIDN